MELSKKDILAIVASYAGVILFAVGVGMMVGVPEVLRNVPYRELAGLGLVVIGVVIAAVGNVKGME